MKLNFIIIIIFKYPQEVKISGLVWSRSVQLPILWAQLVLGWVTIWGLDLRLPRLFVFKSNQIC